MKIKSYKLIFNLFFYLFCFNEMSYCEIMPSKGPVFLQQYTPKDWNILLFNQDGLYTAYAAYLLPYEQFYNAKRQNLEIQTHFWKVGDSHYNYLMRDKLFAVNANNQLSYRYKNDEGVYLSNRAVVNQYGLCAGFTTTLKKFHYLAFFEPGKLSGYNRDSEPELWLEYYKKLIDKIMKNEAVVFPEFSSLFELSSTILGEYLNYHIAEQWVQTNLNLQGIISFLESSNMDKAELVKVLKNLQWYIDRHFQPSIYLGSGGKNSSHVVRVVSIEEDEEKYVLNLINTDGSYFKKNFPKNLNSYERLNIVAFQKAEMVDMILSLEKFCHNNPVYCQNIKN